MKEQAELQLAGISLKKSEAAPLYRQLYEGIRQNILGGQLRPGERLPATREMARVLNVSRNTIALAYDCLLAEGYIVGFTGSGTYVNQDLPEEFTQAYHPAVDSPPQHPPQQRRLSQRSRLLTRPLVGPGQISEEIRPFRHGTPALRDFPEQLWARLAARCWRDMKPALLWYHDPAGYHPLREAIAAYLRRSRAVNCEAEQVIVINGAQQGLNLAANILLDPGDTVWVEDPCYLGTKSAMQIAGANLVPVPVDDEGLNIEAGKQVAPSARMVYVTPSYQFPLGITMSLKRRLHLLQWAEQAGAWILEDDYDSEFRYSGPPLASLQGLDVQQRVIYVGTFSKVLFPGLRLGYLVVPPDLVDAFASARAVADRGSSMVEQVVVAEFMAQGHFGRHIRRMRVLYQSRQQVLIEALAQHLPNVLRVQPSEAGMHLIGRLPPDADDRAVSEKLAQAGVIAAPLSSYTLQHPCPPGLVLGYTAYSKLEIKRAVKRLAQVLKTAFN